MLISTLLFLLLYRVGIKKLQLATQLAKCQVFLAGKAYGHRRVMKQRRLKSEQRRNWEAENVSVSVLS